MLYRSHLTIFSIDNQHEKGVKEKRYGVVNDCVFSKYLDNFNKQDKIGSYDKYKAIFVKFPTFLTNRSVSLLDIGSKCTCSEFKKFN